MAVLVVLGELLLPGWIQKFRAACAAYYTYTGGGKSVLDVFLTPLCGRVLAALLVAVSLILPVAATACRRKLAELSLLPCSCHGHNSYGHSDVCAL